VTAGPWRCPLCDTLADDPRQHLADAHGVGSGPDRFGLRDAARPAPGRGPRPLPADDAAGGDDLSVTGEDVPESPLVWRRAPRPRPRSGSSGTNGTASIGSGQASRPRSPSRRTRSVDNAEDVRPARPEPLPPEAAVLRLVCDSLDGVDVAKLHDRLVALPGVDAVTIDLYDRTVDLYLDRARATPRPLVTLAATRVRLPIRLAELHRAAPRGERLGEATRIYVLQ